MTNAYINKDCGCLEKSQAIGMFETIIHIEPNGNGELFLDCGDWDDEVTFHNCKTIDELEQKAIEYISSIPFADL